MKWLSHGLRFLEFAAPKPPFAAAHWRSPGTHSGRVSAKPHGWGLSARLEVAPRREPALSWSGSPRRRQAPLRDRFGDVRASVRPTSFEVRKNATKSFRRFNMQLRSGSVRPPNNALERAREP